MSRRGEEARMMASRARFHWAYQSPLQNEWIIPDVKSLKIVFHVRFVLTKRDRFIGKYAKRLGPRYVVCTSDLHEENGITYLPIYMSHLL